MKLIHINDLSSNLIWTEDCQWHLIELIMKLLELTYFILIAPEKYNQSLAELQWLCKIRHKGTFIDLC